MKIKKDDKEYVATERKSYWSVIRIAGALTVDFQVSKEICKTEAELREYIMTNEMF